MSTRAAKLPHPMSPTARAGREATNPGIVRPAASGATA